MLVGRVEGMGLGVAPDSTGVDGFESFIRPPLTYMEAHRWMSQAERVAHGYDTGMT